MKSTIAIFFLVLATTSGALVEYTLRGSYTDLSPNGVRRATVVVNKTLPGPPLTANEGDNVVIYFYNDHPTLSMSLHWHGQRQRGTPYSDGAVGGSQCAVGSRSMFKYNFTAEAGTYFYHSHVGAQWADGLFGAFIVNKASDKSRYRYDEERTIMINDWAHLTSEEIYALQANIQDAQGGDIARSYLINGKARFDCSLLPESFLVQMENGLRCFPNAPLSITNVTRGKTYRLRLINAGVGATRARFAIDGHNLTVIQADGNAVVPYTVQAIDLSAAQRYDVLLTTNKAPGNYLISVTRISPQERTTVVPPQSEYGSVYPGFATLHYDNVEYQEANSSSFVAASNDVTLDEYSLLPSFNAPVQPPNTTVVLKLGVGVNTDEVEYNPAFLWQFNGIAFHDRPGHFPDTLNAYLHPWEYNTNIEQAATDSAPNVPPNGLVPFLQSAVRKYNHITFGYNRHVRVVVENNFLLAHPMHLHGHTFQVVGHGVGSYNASACKTQNAVVRDTYTLIPNEWVAIQFYTDNPGSWMFHCHMGWHQIEALNVNFVVAPDRIVPPPADFPFTCGPTPTYNRLISGPSNPKIYFQLYNDTRCLVADYYNAKVISLNQCTPPPFPVNAAGNNSVIFRSNDFQTFTVEIYKSLDCSRTPATTSTVRVGICSKLANGLFKLLTRPDL